ncbi:uncharacterized protein [Macaca nemestrina]|uniref:uncharacterized protein isoform X2 n=1 Tax=Macaca nemestrina TaxID=9545 RepID=UPI0039B8F611
MQLVGWHAKNEHDGRGRLHLYQCLECPVLCRPGSFYTIIQFTVCERLVSNSWPQVILLPQPPKRYDCRHEPLCPAEVIFYVNLDVLELAAVQWSDHSSLQSRPPGPKQSYPSPLRSWDHRPISKLFSWLTCPPWRLFWQNDFIQASLSSSPCGKHNTAHSWSGWKSSDETCVESVLHGLALPQFPKQKSQNLPVGCKVCVN